jgi:hypothetical protein
MNDRRMTEAYALIAWREKYTYTGVMTFVVNQDGRVCQKNLGPETATAARAITATTPIPAGARSTVK